MAEERILLVEDDTMMQRIMKTALLREGYAIDTAKNGKEGMELLRDNDFNYDLVIADVMMPYINGFELVNHIKTSERAADIAVIIVSSLNNEESVLEGFEMGADDYIKKPIIPSELTIRVKRLLLSKKGSK